MEKKIIAADDSSSFRHIYESAFEIYLGMRIETVPTGNELVEKVSQEKYDLIITDNKMSPGISGLEAAAMIREFGNYVPIIMVSGDVIDGVLASEVGITDFIHKDSIMSYKDFAQKMKKYLSD